MLSLLLLTLASCSAAVRQPPHTQQRRRYDWPERYGDHVVEFPIQPLYDRGQFCFGLHTHCNAVVVTVTYGDVTSVETVEESDETNDATLYCSNPIERGVSFVASLKCGEDHVVSVKATSPPAPPKNPLLVGVELTETGWLKLEVDADDDNVVQVYRILRSWEKLGRTTVCRPCLPLLVTSYEHVRELMTRGGVLTSSLKFEDPFDGRDHIISSSTSLQPLESLLSTWSTDAIPTMHTTPGGTAAATNQGTLCAIFVGLVVSYMLL